jgi:hypothetical protein
MEQLGPMIAWVFTAMVFSSASSVMGIIKAVRRKFNDPSAR